VNFYLLRKVLNFSEFLITSFKFWGVTNLPLKMNLIPEIRMDQKRNLETLPSILLLSLPHDLKLTKDSRCELASYLEMW
jgi:hypothetical protein